jgi:hypothetical protein
MARMCVHIIKLCVGANSVADLAAWQAERLDEARRQQTRHKTAPFELTHITRQTPKRKTEILNGGSLYWVIKGRIAVRQKLLDLRPVTRDGIPHCALVYDPLLILVEPRPRRAFQGWRYLDPADAPPDLAANDDQSANANTAALREALSDAGLL